MWSTEKLMDARGLDVPIIQAPMAGANGSAMMAAALGREMSSGDLTRTIVEGTQMHFEKLSGN